MLGHKRVDSQFLLYVIPKRMAESTVTMISLTSKS